MGHCDYRAEHVRFTDGQISAVYDWDSLAVGPEPVVVGLAAHNFTADWSRDGWHLPTLAESFEFISNYQTARGAPFTPEERQAASVAMVAALSYSARCEHSDRLTAFGTQPPGPSPAAVPPGAYLDRLATDGPRLLGITAQTPPTGARRLRVESRKRVKIVTIRAVDAGSFRGARALVDTRLMPGSGTVFIGEDSDREDFSMWSGRWSAHWEPRGTSSPREGPQAVSASEAIAWGRAQADVVLIRPGDSIQHYSAGHRNPGVDDLDDLPVWPEGKELERRRDPHHAYLDRPADAQPIQWRVRYRFSLAITDLSQFAEHYDSALNRMRRSRPWPARQRPRASSLCGPPPRPRPARRQCRRLSGPGKQPGGL